MQRYSITGMSCAACSARIEKAVMAVAGVTACSVSLLTNSMTVEGSASQESTIKAVMAAGYGAAPLGRESGNGKGKSPFGKPGSISLREQEELLKDNETPKLKKRLGWSLLFLLLLMYISTGHMAGLPLPVFLCGNHIAIGLAQLILAATVMTINQNFFISGTKSLMKGSPNMDTLVALGSGMSFIYSTSMLFSMTAPHIAGNAEKAAEAAKDLYFEGSAMILALITAGKLLESISKGKTKNALKNLIKIAPKTAMLLKDGKEQQIPIEELRPGDIFAVKPGESIPADGTVIEGASAADESMLTGESMPISKSPGSKVSAATINQSGYLKCRADKIGEDTALAQIIQLVSDASATKAPIAKAADKVSAIFVPSVIAISAITITAWLAAGQDLGFALSRGISVLVISCPCALGLATPVAIMAGSGIGARNGILFKTAAALEEAGKIKFIALDKTGTITHGRPEVTDIIPAEGCSEEQLLSAAASLEAKSEHPLAKAVLKYCNDRNIYAMETKDFKAIPGEGLSAAMKYGIEDSHTATDCAEPDKECKKTECADSKCAEFGKENAEAEKESRSHETRNECEKLNSGNKEFASSHYKPAKKSSDSAKTSLSNVILYGGSIKFIRENTGIKAEIPTEMLKKAKALADRGKTPLAFASRNESGMHFLGIISAADTIKEDSARAAQELQEMGLETIMLTGDNERTAAAIGRQAGIRQVIAGVLPSGKEAAICRLQERGKTAMAGDGINDAPALARADIGIAIGTGTDIAIDAADIVLMNSRLTDLCAMIRLSRAVLRNIHENLFWAFFYNVLLIPVAAGVYYNAFGLTLNPIMAAASMSISSLCVILNALRLNLKNIHGKEKQKKTSQAKSASKDKLKSENEAISGNKVSSDIESSNKAKEKIMTKIYKVEGMMCKHCEMHVKKAIEAIEGIEEAEADHKKSTVSVKMNREIPSEQIAKAVSDAGYDFKG